jgi:hypothetical protein
MENQSNNVCGISNCQGPCRIVGGALAIALIVYVAALAANAVKSNKYIGRGDTGQASVSVSGVGEIYRNPDLAVMNFSVVSEGKTVAEAMADNTEKMNRIADVTKSLGVEEKDLQTANFNINPRYDYVKAASPTLPPSSEIAVDEEYYYPSGKRTLSGYDVTQTLTVKMRNMANIGTIIEEVAAAGANQAGSLQFTLDDVEAAQDEARKLAIDDAKEKAEILAKQLGVKLVRIVSYGDSGYAPVYRLNYAKAESMDSTAGMGGAAPAPDIQTGENKITANVSLVYEIE